MEEEFQLLREAYLPQVILAYISIMRFAGGALSRKYLMECMELSALLAEEGSDLLDLFVKTGQMQDLMNKLAGASKDLLILSSTRPSTASRGKKMRMKGWTHELWSVKP